MIGAVSDGISEYTQIRGTPEIVGQNGLVIKEFPDDLSHNLEGINYTKSSHSRKLFRKILQIEGKNYLERNKIVII